MQTRVEHEARREEFDRECQRLAIAEDERRQRRLKELARHNLIVVGYYPSSARCACGRWRYYNANDPFDVADKYEEIERAYKAHINVADAGGAFK